MSRIKSPQYNTMFGKKRLAEYTLDEAVGVGIPVNGEERFTEYERRQVSLVAKRLDTYALALRSEFKHRDITTSLLFAKLGYDLKGYSFFRVSKSLLVLTSDLEKTVGGMVDGTLFVHPDFRGKKIGRHIHLAIDEFRGVITAPISYSKGGYGSRLSAHREATIQAVLAGRKVHPENLERYAEELSAVVGLPGSTKSALIKSKDPRISDFINDIRYLGIISPGMGLEESGYLGSTDLESIVSRFMHGDCHLWTAALAQYATDFIPHMVCDADGNVVHSFLSDPGRSIAIDANGIQPLGSACDYWTSISGPDCLLREISLTDLGIFEDDDLLDAQNHISLWIDLAEDYLARLGDGDHVPGFE